MVRQRLLVPSFRRFESCLPRYFGHPDAEQSLGNGTLEGSKKICLSDSRSLLILAGSSSEGLIRVKEKERFESSPTDFFGLWWNW